MIPFGHLTAFGLPFVQVAAFGLVIAMLGLFMWGKLRYDLVAMLILLAGAALGVVNPKHAFEGFSNPVIIIIASVLIVSKAISTSGVLNGLMTFVLGRVKSTSGQVGVLTAFVTFLSAFIKNVGTLGIFMPVAMDTAKRAGRSPSIYLMPLAFGSLIGGTITKIGTSPNLLISEVRLQNGGKEPFALFDFLYVGLPLSCAAILFLMIGWRLIPQRIAAVKPGGKKTPHYTTELRILEDSPLIGKNVSEIETLAGGDLIVTSIIRDNGHEYFPSRSWILYKNDIIAVRADPKAAAIVVDKGKLQIVGADELEAPEGGHPELEVVEAVVTEDSPLVGNSPEAMRLRRRYDVNLLAISRSGTQITTRIGQHLFRPGDVIVFQGWSERLPSALQELGCLPLADRGLSSLGRQRQGVVSLAILAIAMVLISTKMVPVDVGFFGAAVMILLFKQLSLKEAYEAIEWPVIIMLGCLIPVGEGLKETGATDVVAQVLSTWAANMPGIYALGMMLVASMILTPFLHHAAAVLVLGPVAAVLATNLGYNIDPFLMAVALGCACDFLTPIGHQNNLLVMGPGGYRFFDYWRLGLPLSIIIAVGGTLLISYFWPL